MSFAAVRNAAKKYSVVRHQRSLPSIKNPDRGLSRRMAVRLVTNGDCQSHSRCLIASANTTRRVLVLENHGSHIRTSQFAWDSTAIGIERFFTAAQSALQCRLLRHFLRTRSSSPNDYSTVVTAFSHRLYSGNKRFAKLL